MEVTRAGGQAWAPAQTGPSIGAGPADPLAVTAAKAVMRKRIRGERRRRSVDERRADGERLRDVVLNVPQIRGARWVACYAALAGEPDTTALRQALLAAGTRVLLPVLRGDHDLDWVEDRAVEDRTVDDRAYQDRADQPGERLPPTALVRVDVVLAPALAVDTLGRRLGQGGGSYDRALARVAGAVPVVALVHDEEVLDAAVQPVPTLSHDRRVDAVATPSRYLRLVD